MGLYSEGRIFGRVYIRNDLSVSEYHGLIQFQGLYWGGGGGGLCSGGLRYYQNLQMLLKFPLEKTCHVFKSKHSGMRIHS